MSRGNVSEAEKHFEQECIALLREIEGLSKTQETMWEDVHDIVSHNEDVALQIEMISDSRRHQLYNAQEKAARLAQSISDSAHIAKESSKRVKQMDALKGRVNATLELANGISKQRTLLEGTSDALEKNDFEGAAEFIANYCEIESQLQDIAQLEEGDEEEEVASPDDSRVDAQSLSSEGEGEGGWVGVKRPGYSLRETSSLLQKKREEVRNAIRIQFNEAATACDRDGVLRLSKLFGKIGLESEGRLQYCNWLRQACGSQLESRISTALSELDNGSTKHTHLDLVNEVIDHTLNALESEEEHVLHYFGGKGVVSMCSALHRECTSHAVVILNSFLKSNQSILFSLNSKQSQDDVSSSPRGFSDLVGASSPVADPVNKFLHDKKSMDKTLEEISHVANFCNLYFNFVKERLVKNAEEDMAETPQSPKTASAVEEALGDNKLMEKLQELLLCYAPLQRKYLVSVFEHASTQACRKVSENHQIERDDSNSSATRVRSEFMSRVGLNNLNLPGANNPLNFFGGDSVEDSLDREALLVMIDDVFTVLRTCLMRAVRIRTVHIVRCIVNSMNDLIRDHILQLIMEKLVFRGKNELAVSPSCLVWMDVLFTVQGYTAKLSLEFERLVDRHIRAEFPEDASELAATAGGELNVTADTLADVLQRNVQKTTGVVTKQMYAKGLAKFEQLSYVLGEVCYLLLEIFSLSTSFSSGTSQPLRNQRCLGACRTPSVDRSSAVL